MSDYDKEQIKHQKDMMRREHELMESLEEKAKDGTPKSLLCLGRKLLSQAEMKYGTGYFSRSYYHKAFDLIWWASEKGSQEAVNVLKLMIRSGLIRSSSLEECYKSLVNLMGTGLDYWPVTVRESLTHWSHTDRKKNHIPCVWRTRSHEWSMPDYDHKYIKAFVSWRALAETGNVNAQLKVAFMYEVCCGVPWNEDKVCEWYEKAAKQGSRKAKNKLKFWKIYNHQTTTDFKKIRDWCKKAEKQADKLDQGEFLYRVTYDKKIPEELQAMVYVWEETTEQFRDEILSVANYQEKNKEATHLNETQKHQIELACRVNM